MFAPRYFPTRHYAQRYFPPGAAVEDDDDDTITKRPWAQLEDTVLRPRRPMKWRDREAEDEEDIAMIVSILVQCDII